MSEIFTPNLPSSPPTFDGKTFSPDRDGNRLRAQLARVTAAMQSSGPMTLEQIAEKTGDPTPSIGARLRDLRKPKFGGHTVKRAYVGNGLWTYELLSS